MTGEVTAVPCFLFSSLEWSNAEIVESQRENYHWQSRDKLWMRASNNPVGMSVVVCRVCKTSLLPPTYLVLGLTTHNYFYVSGEKVRARWEERRKSCFNYELVLTRLSYSNFHFPSIGIIRREQCSRWHNNGMAPCSSPGSPNTSNRDCHQWPDGQVQSMEPVNMFYLGTVLLGKLNETSNRGLGIYDFSTRNFDWQFSNPSLMVKLCWTDKKLEGRDTS